MPLPLWLPSEVLQLDPNSSDFTCVSYAPSKGRRCHNPIACTNRQEAANILKEMSMLDPHSKRLDKRLEELAPRLLCRRWHQNQAADMKTLWRREIDRHYPAIVHIERYTVVYAPSVSPTSTMVRTRAKPRTTGRITSSVAHSPVETFAPEPLPVATITERRRSTRTSNDLRAQEPRQQAASNLTSSTQPDSILHLPEPNSPSTSFVTEAIRHTSDTAPQEPSPVTERTRSTSDTLPEETSPQIEPTPNTPGTAAPQESPATREEQPNESSTPEQIPEPTQKPNPHEGPLHTPTRRTLEADCPICCEELSIYDETAWCKAQCHHAFHAACIKTWHGFQKAEKRRKSCPYCRAKWAA